MKIYYTNGQIRYTHIHTNSGRACALWLNTKAEGKVDY